MKVIGYARVSTKGQEDNSSLDTQEQDIREYCKRKGYELVDVYREASSGTRADTRPIFQSAIERVMNDCDGMVVAKLDRFGRNLRDRVNLVEDIFKANNKALMLIDLDIDTSSVMGKGLLDFMCVFASIETGRRGERVTAGLEAKRQAGGFIGGQVPFGMTTHNKELAPNPQELEVIDIIRKHRKSGKSYQRVADYLNEHNYPSKRGGKWYAMSVKYICDNLKERLNQA